LKYVEEINDAQYELTKKTIKENCEKLQGRRKAAKRENRKAKMKWQSKLARKYKDEEFTMPPKETWKVRREIEKCFKGHLPKITSPPFSKPDGLNATSYDENTDILKNHFQAVFSRRDVMTDSTRLLAVLEGNIVEEQFTTKLCHQVIHSLRALMSLRRARDIYTDVLFVDPVKACDTVNHALLFGILNQYGIPEELVEVFKRMYKDCKLLVQVVNETKTID
jgi:hypothetical protein